MFGLDLVATFTFPTPFGRTIREISFAVDRGKRFAPSGLHVRERDAILGALWACQAGLYSCQIEFHDLGELWNWRAIAAEEALFLGVTLDQFDLSFRATGLAQVAECLIVDRKEAHRGAVLGRHVADRRAVSDSHRRYTGSEELHKLADDFFLSQDFGDGEN